MSLEVFNQKWLDNHFKAVSFIRNELEKQCLQDSQEEHCQRLIKFIFSDDTITTSLSGITVSATNMEYFINRIIGALLDDGDICFIEFGLRYEPMIIFMDSNDLSSYLKEGLSKNKNSIHHSILGIDWNRYYAITDIHTDPIRFINSYENVRQSTSAKRELAKTIRSDELK